MQNNLHPGARWLFRLRGIAFFFPLVFFAIFFSVVVLQSIPPSLYDLNLNLILFALVLMLTPFVFFFLLVEVYARMSYNRYLYEFTSKELKIEKGIIWKKYTSIPYERIQNVDIKRGIIARIFGFSTVDIETAGRSGFGAHYGWQFGNRRNQVYESEGHLPAISIEGAEKIREFVLSKIKQTESGI